MTDPAAKGDWLVNLSEARRLIAEQRDTDRAAFVLKRGSMRVGIYSPRGSDPQTPHLQDEIYLVLVGSGTFVLADARRPFAVGDLIFVPAGSTHRFEDFSDDLETCVLFWGPEGGESV